MDGAGVPVPRREGLPDVPIHRREPLPAQARTELVWRRVAPLSGESELLWGDEILGEMSQATRDGFDAWGECLGESWDLRFDGGWFGNEVVACDPESGQAGVTLDGFLSRAGMTVTGYGELRWSSSLLLARAAVRDDGGEDLLNLRSSLLHGFYRSRTRVEVARDLVDSPLLPRLLLFSWFVRLYQEGGGIKPFRRVKP